MKRISEQNRFWSKVEKTDTCWLWKAACSSGGYGYFRLKGKTELAHRLAYEWLVGDIPPGLELDHLCRRRECIRPDHLEPVTRQENLRRGVGNQHKSKTNCLQDHEYSDENTYIDKIGSRHCRECNKLFHKQYRIRKM